jgi:hypothetical protein
MPLQDALKSGSEANVRAALGLLKQFKDVFKKNLFYGNKFKYNALHQAANTPKANNRELVKILIDAIEEVFEEGGRDILTSLAQDASKFKNSRCGQSEVLRLIDEAFPNRAYVPAFDRHKLGPAKDDSSSAKTGRFYESRIRYS